MYFHVLLLDLGQHFFFHVFRSLFCMVVFGTAMREQHTTFAKQKLTEKETQKQGRHLCGEEPCWPPKQTHTVTAFTQTHSPSLLSRSLSSSNLIAEFVAGAGDAAARSKETLIGPSLRLGGPAVSRQTSRLSTCMQAIEGPTALLELSRIAGS